MFRNTQSNRAHHGFVFTAQQTLFSYCFEKKLRRLSFIQTVWLRRRKGGTLEKIVNNDSGNKQGLATIDCLNFADLWELGLVIETSACQFD